MENILTTIQFALAIAGAFSLVMLIISIIKRAMIIRKYKRQRKWLRKNVPFRIKPDGTEEYLDETDYLLSSKANKKRLLDSLD